MGSMAGPGFLEDRSLAGLLAAVAREPAARWSDVPGLDLTRPLRREGWESVVLETPDWIVRFPKHRDPARFHRELAVLAHVRGRLPVRTPEVAWIGENTYCMAYPRIVGRTFTQSAWHAASEHRRRGLARSLAELLTAWREAFRGVDVDRWGFAAVGDAQYVDQLTTALPRFPVGLRPAVETLLAGYRDLYRRELAESGVAFLHGDFHLGNMVLDETAPVVTGLWDFSCVGPGVFTWDLHYLAGEISDPAGDPAPPGTGAHLDLLRGVVADLPDLPSPERTLLLADLMSCAEWIGDHDPADSLRWRDWLARL